MLAKIAIRLFAFSFFCVGIAAADVMPVRGTQRVKPIFDRSDLVCMCTAESTHTAVQEGLWDSATRRPVARVTTTMTFAIAIAYKENRSVTQQLAIRWVEDSPLPLRPQVPFKKGQPFLLFLVSISPTMYETADRFLGMNLFSIISPGTTAGGFPGLEMTLAQIVAQPDREDKLRALELLEGFDAISQQTEALMWRIADSSDFEIAMTAWAVLLKSKSSKVVAGLLGYLNAHAPPQEPTDALVGVEEGLSSIRNERALASLEQLASSKYFEVRSGALYALRGMKDPRSVRTLIQSLDDERPELQYRALITLAEILGKYEGDYAPSMYLFDKEPQHYIGLWKQWWTEEGSKLYPPASAPS
jgi:hypothetical protein